MEISEHVIKINACNRLKTAVIGYNRTRQKFITLITPFPDSTTHTMRERPARQTQSPRNLLYKNM